MPPAPVRLLTLNAWGVPTARDLAERFDALPGALLALRPDVICLQEVWLARHRDALLAALGAGWRAAEPHQGGLLVLSRLPLAEARFTPFESLEGASLIERLAGKGWLEAVVRAPWGPLRVVNTHLAFEGPREAQCQELLAALRGRRDLPVVLVGDFNLRGYDPALLAARDQGLFDLDPPHQDAGGAWVDAPPTRLGWPRSEAPRGRGWRPDRIFLRDLHALAHGMALHTPATALSDHNLLWVDLTLD